jgi:hypothetical protein
MIARLMIARRFIALALLAVLALGVCAECQSGEGGWYQGGGDSVPRDRR